MTEAELLLALAPVNRHFRGKTVSVNTVLAAHMRAIGLKPVGAAWQTAKGALEQGASFEAAALSAKGGGSRMTVAPRRAVPTPVEEWTGSALKWFPKPFGPGDIDGIGSRRLLGQPYLNPTDLLVREMAQNAWDARDASGSLEFTLNLRKLTPAEISVLESRVLTGRGEGLGLQEFFQLDEPWCLEVSDRGTVGLDGPIRNDFTVPSGEPRNFIDLIFNIGAPRDVHLGGGTYGFGKTITYVISRVSTVLVWSRCRTQRGLEHRLIGSAMGEAFDDEGLSYTGRSWWGNVVEGNNLNIGSSAAQSRIEPAVGEDARLLAEEVFQSRFIDGQTGTSFLIPDPLLTGKTREDQARRLAESVLCNLWPKLLIEQQGRPRMDIRVLLNGEPVEITPPEEHPVISGYARCLQAVREVQSGTAELDAFEPFIKVAELRSQRPKALLGHLALTRTPVREGAEPQRSVAWMRHQAELVVKYSEMEKLEVPGFQWMGVFKPSEEVDDSFAASEPPAHDDWVPAAMQNPTQKRHVNIGLRRIKEAVGLFLTPASLESGNSGPKSSVAHIGDMLSGLVAGAVGAGPSRRKPGGSGPPRGTSGGRPSLTLAESGYWADIRPGWATTILEVSVESSSEEDFAVELIPRVGIDGGSLEAEDAVRVHGWGSAPESGPWVEGPVTVNSTTTLYFCYEHRSDISIDIRTKIAEAL